MNETENGYVGSQGGNWHPATKPHEYLRNCKEGIETFSERRFAKLMGWSPIHLYRVKLMAELPEAFFDALQAARARGTKIVATLVVAFRLGDLHEADAGRCPHCGGALGVPSCINRKALEVS
jgi:hypothetical protein